MPALAKRIHELRDSAADGKKLLTLLLRNAMEPLSAKEIRSVQSLCNSLEIPSDRIDYLDGVASEAVKQWPLASKRDELDAARMDAIHKVYAHRRETNEKVLTLLKQYKHHAGNDEFQRRGNQIHSSRRLDHFQLIDAANEAAALFAPSNDAYVKMIGLLAHLTTLCKAPADSGLRIMRELMQPDQPEQAIEAEAAIVDE